MIIGTQSQYQQECVPSEFQAPVLESLLLR